jgi:hypothetical protein
VKRSSTNSRGAAGHGLKHREAKLLGDLHFPAVARPMHGGQHDHLGTAVQHWKHMIRDLTGKRHQPSGGQPAQQLPVAILWGLRIMAAGAHARQFCAGRQRPDQPVQALVRGQLADEEYTAALLGGVGKEAAGVSTPVRSRSSWERRAQRLRISQPLFAMLRAVANGECQR